MPGCGLSRAGGRSWGDRQTDFSGRGFLEQPDDLAAAGSGGCRDPDRRCGHRESAARGGEQGTVRRLCADKGIDDVDCPPRRAPKRPARPPQRAPLGKRWIVERTNSWLSNFGQLRRNADRTTGQRLSQLALAVTVIIAIKLIKWADRHNQ